MAEISSIHSLQQEEKNSSLIGGTAIQRHSVIHLKATKAAGLTDNLILVNKDSSIDRVLGFTYNTANGLNLETNSGASAHTWTGTTVTFAGTAAAVLIECGILVRHIGSK